MGQRAIAVVSVRAFEGTYSGYYSESAGGPSYRIYWTDLTVQQGQLVEARLWSDEANERSGFLFGVTDDGSGPSGYGLGHQNAGSNHTVTLYRLGGGSPTTLAQSGTTPPKQEWLRAEADWGSDGTIVYTLQDSSGNQVEQLSATDTTYEAGGIGWYGRAGKNAVQMYVDYARAPE